MREGDKVIDTIWLDVNKLPKGKKKIAKYLMKEFENKAKQSKKGHLNG